MSRRKGEGEANAACPRETSALNVELERAKITGRGFQSAIHCKTSRRDLSQVDTRHPHTLFSLHSIHPCRDSQGKGQAHEHL